MDDQASTPLATRAWLRAGRLQYSALQALVNRTSGLHLDELEIGGCRVPVLQGGVGPALLLLHGFADAKETWSLLFRALAGRYTVIAPDLPGYGGAGPVEPRRATIRAQTEHVVELLDALGRRRVHVCGNSMGGGIGARLAWLHAERVASLTLLGPMGPLREPSVAQQRWEAGEGNPLLPASLAEYDAMLSIVLEQRPPLPRAVRAWLAERQRLRREEFSACFDVLVAAATGEDAIDEEELRRVTTPTLVLHGAADRIVHPSTGRAYGELLPNARVVELDGVGHAPQLEAPRLTLRYLIQHIEEASRAGR